MFKLSQTALKDLENPSTCPLRWKGLWLDSAWESPTTEAMNKGSYFEWLVLGYGATSTMIKELPRLKSGEKSVDQIRIEKQAERVKEMFNPSSPTFLGFTIHAVQVELSDAHTKGTADIWVVDKEGGSWLIDLKLTKDLTSTFGQYAWGKPWEELDLIQLPHYQDLFASQYGHSPRMALFVVDYSPQMRIEFSELTISEERRATKDIRFKKGRELIDDYIKEGFPVDPSEPECKRCKLNCEFRLPPQQLLKI